MEPFFVVRVFDRVFGCLFLLTCVVFGAVLLLFVCMSLAIGTVLRLCCTFVSVFFIFLMDFVFSFFARVLLCWSCDPVAACELPTPLCVPAV